MRYDTQRAAGVVGALAVCGYLLFIRVYDLDENFWLLSEQVRDWAPTQRPFADLPLAGPRSLNSGADIGPAYYWFLWLSHAALAPVLGSFPHTGGWAISLLHAAADVLLLVALWKRLQSWPLAAAIVLLVGSSPYDVGLTSTIWNPPVASGLAKLATAAMLWNESLSTMTSVLAIVCAWLAVQMHLTALVIAVPFTLWVAYAAGSSKSLHRMALCAVALVASVALVAVPYAINPVAREGAGVSASISRVAADPFDRIRVIDSAAAAGRALDLILATPLNQGWLGWVIAAGAIAFVVTTPLSALSVCTFGVLAATVALFSLWQGAFGEYYWFLVIAPAAAVCAFGPVALLAPRRRTLIGGLLLGAFVLLQPARVDFAWGTAFRLPAYGALRRGAVAVAASRQPVRDLTAAFAIPSGVDPAFLLQLAGGHLDPASPLTATIQTDGSVRIAEDR